MDLTNSVLEAKFFWSEVEKFIDNISHFADLMNLTIDFDVQDGETWGRLLKKSKVVLIFNSTIPLSYVDAEYFERLNKYMIGIGFKNYVAMEVKSWTEKLYSIDKAKIESSIKWQSSAVNTKNFSINDFWYATI